MVVFQKWRWTEMHGTLGLLCVVALRKAWPRTCSAGRCPHCPRHPLGKRGPTARGTPRSLCQTLGWPTGRCRRAASHRGGWPEVTPPRIDRRLHARGGRDTARAVPSCPPTALRALQKPEARLEAVHTAVRRPLPPAEGAWAVERAGAAELASWGRLSGTKATPAGSGLPSLTPPAQAWPTAVVAAQPTACGSAKPCGLTRDSPEHRGADPRHLDPAVPRPGTRNTQKSARTPLP